MEGVNNRLSKSTEIVNYVNTRVTPPHTHTHTHRHAHTSHQYISNY